MSLPKLSKRWLLSNLLNQVHLQAVIESVSPLRFTPAGMPVLDLVLSHQSIQQEAEGYRQVQVTVEAKIIGENAKYWQHGTGKIVDVTGFLSRISMKNNKVLLHIQTIYLYKG